MNKDVFISVWIVVFLFVALTMLIPYGGTRCHFIGFDSNMFVLPAQDGYEVLTEAEFDQRGMDYDLFYDRGGRTVTQMPRLEYGPWERVLELYTDYSYMPDAKSMRIYADDDLSAEERSAIYAAVVQHAKSIPALAAYDPGKPPRRDWLVMKIVFVLLLLLGIPSLIALVVERFHWLFTGGIEARRMRQGECVHCAYDCVGLDTPTCPECGQPYTIGAAC